MVRMIIRNSIMVVIARFSLDTPRSDDFFELSHIGLIDFFSSAIIIIAEARGLMEGFNVLILLVLGSGIGVS